MWYIKKKKKKRLDVNDKFSIFYQSRNLYSDLKFFYGAWIFHLNIELETDNSDE